MKKISLGCYLLGLSLALPASGWARDCSFEKYWTLPVTYNRRVPTVPITINEKDVNIGFDTGASKTAVSKEGAEILGLNTLDKKMMQVAGVGKTETVDIAVLPSMEFAGVTYKQRALPLVDLPQNANNANNPDAAPLIGLLGVDFLYLYDVEYDLSTQTITLYKVQSCHGDDLIPWPGNYTRVTGNYPSPNQLNIPITLAGQKLNAIFDTGATSTLMSLRAAAKVGVTQEMMEKDPIGHGTGVGKEGFESRIHTFSAITIGSETLHDFPIAITNSEGVKFDILLGEDFMRTHRFWISYATHSIFIQPVGQ